MDKIKKKKFKLTDNQKTQIYGFLFFLPWLIGFLAFFITPFIMTINFSFNKLSINDSSAGLNYTYIGFDNFRYVFGKYKINEDMFFSRYLFKSILNVVLLLPAITVFSLIIAVILNQKFRGRGIARVLFFIPIIFGLPTIVGSFASETNLLEFDQSLQDNPLYKLFDVMGLFTKANIAPFIFTTITKLVKGTFQIIMLSGVQILIFLAAIQSINPALYEVAEIEGASKYEQFFKITLPSIFPILSAVVIYTLIDLLYRSPITKLITDIRLDIQYRATISVVFTITTIVLLVLIVIILKVAQGGKYERKKA